MKQDWFALGSILFLICVFALSFILLKRTIRTTNTAKIGNTSENHRRVLNEEERARVAQRLEREALRERREIERLRQQEAYETAKPSAYAEKLRKREEERLLREAEEAREKNERESKEAAEYEKWKSQIHVTDKGEDQENSSGALIEDFVECIRQDKILLIEDLASRFNLSTQTVVDRIRDLNQQGIVRGCFDDRGRYIPIHDNLVRSINQCINAYQERFQVSAIQVAINEALYRN